MVNYDELWWIMMNRISYWMKYHYSLYLSDLLWEFPFFFCELGNLLGILLWVVPVTFCLFSGHTIPIVLNSQGLDLFSSVVVSVSYHCLLLLDVWYKGKNYLFNLLWGGKLTKLLLSYYCMFPSDIRKASNLVSVRLCEWVRTRDKCWLIYYVYAYLMCGISELCQF